MPDKYDWQSAKKEYVEAPSEGARPTLEELAEGLGCNASYLRDRASQEGWKVEADRYLQTVADKRKAEKSTALAGELANWDAQCYKAAQAGLALIFSNLRKLHDDVKAFEAGQSGDSRHPVNFKSMDEMTRALERLQKIGKGALGEEEQAIKLNIDFGSLSVQQLARLAAGEDPRYVVGR